MIKRLLPLLCLAAFTPAASALEYNADITAIFGAGNPSTGWTADSENGVTLALRAKNRDTGDTSNTLGVYSFATGSSASNSARALWNFEFSIDQGTGTNYEYYLQIDTDPSTGINSIFGGPINPFAAFGDNATLDSVTQNSENITFFGGDKNAAGIYSYELYAVAAGAGISGTRLADTSITVNVGSPSQNDTSVPDAGTTLTLLGMAFSGIEVFRRKASRQ